MKKNYLCYLLNIIIFTKDLDSLEKKKMDPKGSLSTETGLFWILIYLHALTNYQIDIYVTIYNHIVAVSVLCVGSGHIKIRYLKAINKITRD